MSSVVRALASVVAFLILFGLSVDAAYQAWRLQIWADRTHALSQATARLAQSSAADLQRTLQDLIEDPSLGFRFVAVLEPRGRVRAVAGRYERWPLHWLPADLVRQMRELSYALTSTHGRLALAQGDVLEYALGDPDRRALHDETLARLTRYSALGLFSGSVGVLSMLYFLRRRAPAMSTPAARISRGTSEQSMSALAPAELLSQAGIGLILLDRSLKVRSLNTSAETLTGWASADAVLQSVFSVVRLRGRDGRVLDAELQAAWQSRRPRPIDVWVQGRHGTRQPAEAIAMQLGDERGTTGAALLLRDARVHHDAMQSLEQVSRLPQSLMDLLDEGVLQTDAAGVIRYANARLQSWLGYAPDELRGVGIGKLLPVPFMDPTPPSLADYAVGRPALPTVVAWHKDGTAVPVELKVAAMSGEAGMAVVLRPRAATTAEVTTSSST